MPLKISKRNKIQESYPISIYIPQDTAILSARNEVLRNWLMSMCAILIVLINPAKGYTQQDSIIERIHSVLILDSITISASRTLPDSRFMIRQIINDTTFYRAFQRLRRESFRFSSELYFYKPEGIPYTYMRSIRDQKILRDQRINEIIEEHKARHLMTSKGEYNFYTAKLYDRLFFTDKPTPVPEKWNTNLRNSPMPANKMEKYTQDLKKLLFDPGSKIDIPLMGNKTEIFNEERMQYYHYTLSEEMMKNGEEAYVFNIMADTLSPEKETVIKRLTTTFRKADYQILGRSYHLKYNTILYAFDVQMDIDIGKRQGRYLPYSIHYTGNWKVPFRNPEICTFSFKIVDF